MPDGQPYREIHNKIRLPQPQGFSHIPDSHSGSTEMEKPSPNGHSPKGTGREGRRNGHGFIRPRHGLPIGNEPTTVNTKNCHYVRNLREYLLVSKRVAKLKATIRQLADSSPSRHMHGEFGGFFDLQEPAYLSITLLPLAEYAELPMK
ncbi:hypothetical protein CIB48_g10688 [Xylaria polymorpha]|nr:hypothetical protein CIB48_g10688 [Xylaria polymorpha]